ncbi:MAG TPA: peptide-methionine (S)-S-oxide reductase MsrA [Nitrospinota bacterium]|nr:peptide-methionine (S)-S-oxide reductase MsrA [Nitrospinota bacterium]|tara:strand:+ start:109493 stop:110110 length:618 start_codon:yes stop_codon:yes gene_type:complete
MNIVKQLVLIFAFMALANICIAEGGQMTQNNINTKSAIFAGGCFWCMQHPFDNLAGVVQTVPGYSGGHLENPSYEQVSNGGTGHAEVVKVIYDPSTVTYQKLLVVFWKNIDPADPNGQFCDRGSQYRSGIFYYDGEQKKAAEQSLEELRKTKQFQSEIVTEITKASHFYEAEEYHVDYYKKNPIRYNYYRQSCGRDRRLNQLWGG